MNKLIVGNYWKQQKHGRDMKVIHSFVDKHDFIWKEILYSKFLSAVLAKKHYGNISLFGTPGVVKQAKELSIPYSTFDDKVVSLDDFSTWSIPKIKVFEHMKEPFLHIDNDTFILDKIDFASYNKPFLFSHPDMGIRKFGDGLASDFSRLVNSINTPTGKKKDYFFDVNNTYTRLFIKLIDKIKPEVLKGFELGSIPNMNIVYIEDYKTFSKVCSKTLEHFYSNRELIDSEEYGPCYIEQLTIHQILRSESKNYKKYSSKYKHTIFKKLPFAQLDKFNNVPSINDVTFPFRARLVTKCKCCGKHKEKKIIINSKDDIKNFIDHSFGGFLHSTYLKWYDIMQAFIIHQLRKEIGDDHLKFIHNYFKEKHKNFSLPLKSGGEKLYEEITGFSFDKVGSYKNNSYI